MISTRLMQIPMFNSIWHPCAVTDVLADVCTGEVINLMVGVLAMDMRPAVLIGVFADLVDALEFANPVPLEDSMLFC